MQRLAAATITELEEVPGIPAKTARQVFDYFQQKASTASES